MNLEAPPFTDKQGNETPASRMRHIQAGTGEPGGYWEHWLPPHGWESQDSLENNAAFPIKSGV